MSLIDNLNTIYTSKNAIKSAIGTESDDFSYYASLLEAAKTSYAQQYAAAQASVIKKQYDMSANYLTFEIKEDSGNANASGKLMFYFFVNKAGFPTSISYSINGADFITATYANASTLNGSRVVYIDVHPGDVVRFCASCTRLGTYYSGAKGCKFGFSSSTYSAQWNISVYGNVLSLFYEDDFEGKSLPTDLDTTDYPALASVGCLFSDFQNLLKDASGLILPQPVLGYDFCSMFYKCTGLTKAPQLPFTTLTNDVYKFMFQQCTSLVEAPVLPATTLTENCYYFMFYDCSNLQYVKLYATDKSASNCTTSWLTNTANVGIIIKPSALTLSENSASGVPQNWITAEV